MFSVGFSAVKLANFILYFIDRYVTIFGLRFSKQEHIEFVKLLFELAVTPDQEMCMTHHFVKAFLDLTK